MTWFRPTPGRPPSRGRGQGSWVQGLEFSARGSIQVALCACARRLCSSLSYCSYCLFITYHLVANGTTVGSGTARPPSHGYLPVCRGDGRCSDGAVRLQLPLLAGN
eukprot:scaffold10307_cov120-Isochrysis_galbana.AAC.6